MTTPRASQPMAWRSRSADCSAKWLPLDDGYYLLASIKTSTRAAPLYVLQQALLQVEWHQAQVVGTGESACGILCGEVCTDPELGSEYILLRDTEHAALSRAEHNPDAALAVELATVIAQLERMGRHAVGWYRCGLPPGQPASPLLLGLHRSLFPSPWQVALFREGNMGTGRGMFVRVEPEEGRAFSIPFVEIGAHRRHHDEAPMPTSVGWLNYRAESEVALLPDEAFREGYELPVEEPEEPEPPRRRTLAARFDEWLRVRLQAPSPVLPQPALRRAPGHAVATRAIVVAALLAVAFFAVRQTRAARAAQAVPISSRGAQQQLSPLAPQASQATASAPLAAASLAAAVAPTPDLPNQAQSALARVDVAADSLELHLSALETALAASRDGSSHAAACTRADSLYQKSAADLTTIGVARKQLESLLGPAPLNRVETLTERLAGAQAQLQIDCSGSSL